jgi:hypothetical protein
MAADALRNIANQIEDSGYPLEAIGWMKYSRCTR